MLPLIIAHLVAFFLLFAFGIPASGELFHIHCGFTGGLFAAFAMALACEVIMFVGAILGKFCVDLLGINPLFQKVRAELVSAFVIVLVFVPLLLLISHYRLGGLSLDIGSALGITIAIVAILFGMLHVKRFSIKHFVKG